MKPCRLIWASSALCLLIASCEKQKSASAASGGQEKGDALAAERAALEDERMAFERQQLEEERAALEEEKAALEAEREARLAGREEEADRRDLSLEGRQQALAERELDLSQREGDLADREAGLSDRELELAGRESLDDWEPEYVDDYQEPVADYGTFYNDLQPYGSWFETPDYGYVYQPSIVVQDDSWRPYTRGRWACTNRGWTWVSDEPFGWACFHYGRWTLIAGRGWVWVPGDEWAPSWVCWREGDDCVGWAPLPPETLCYRRRGWNSSVEGDFGISQGCFTFVPCRNMADPIWKHCLPLRENGIFIRKTKNITNIHIDRDRVVCGGPRFERLRKLVGRPWPVYQLETDRFQGLRDLAHRNSRIHGNRLSVFAPGMDTRWNAGLKPQRVSGKWDEVKVVRAEGGIKPEWTERFRQARQKQKEEAVVWKRDHSASDETRQQQLQANREKVAEAQKAFHARQRELVEARRDKMEAKREERQASKGRALPGPAGRQQTASQAAAPDETAQGQTPADKPSLAGRQRELAERMRESRLRGQGEPQAETPRTPSDRVKRPANAPEKGIADHPRERQPQPMPQEQVAPRRERNEGSVAQDQSRREQLEEARVQQQEQMRQRQEENRQRQEAARQDQERSRAEGEENARRQQQEAARGQAEQARRQQAERQRQMEENNRQRQQDEARQQQEQARRQAEDSQRRQQQEEMQRRQQEQARQQQEELARQQQEERARQQEQERARQEERMREQQERARQQEEERARRQEEMQRRQEEARQQQEERARQQQEERARQQEEARRQQEERQRQQEEARQQQEERARQQQEERSRKQQEDSQRQRGGR